MGLAPALVAGRAPSPDTERWNAARARHELRPVEVLSRSHDARELLVAARLNHKTQPQRAGRCAAVVDGGQRLSGLARGLRCAACPGAPTNVVPAHRFATRTLISLLPEHAALRQAAEREQARLQWQIAAQGEVLNLAAEHANFVPEPLIAAWREPGSTDGAGFLPRSR